MKTGFCLRSWRPCLSGCNLDARLIVCPSAVDLKAAADRSPLRGFGP